jgi:hypothetical protein
VAPDSDEWSRFIEAPAGRDLDRLAEHLGLTMFEFPRGWNQLIGRSAHPGIALFVFPDHRKSHAVCVDDIRWLLHHWPTPNGPPAAPGDRPLWRYGWPLGYEHLVRGPLLDAVIVDERQPAQDRP